MISAAAPGDISGSDALPMASAVGAEGSRVDAALQSFGHYFPDAPEPPMRPDIGAAFETVAKAMVRARPPAERPNPAPPPIYAYPGPFIDHDVTAQAESGRGVTRRLVGGAHAGSAARVQRAYWRGRNPHPFETSTTNFQEKNQP